MVETNIKNRWREDVRGRAKTYEDVSEDVSENGRQDDGLQENRLQENRLQEHRLQDNGEADNATRRQRHRWSHGIKRRAWSRIMVQPINHP